MNQALLFEIWGLEITQENILFYIILGILAVYGIWQIVKRGFFPTLATLSIVVVIGTLLSQIGNLLIAEWAFYQNATALFQQVFSGAAFSMANVVIYKGIKKIFFERRQT